MTIHHASFPAVACFCMSGVRRFLDRTCHAALRVEAAWRFKSINGTSEVLVTKFVPGSYFPLARFFGDVLRNCESRLAADGGAFTSPAKISCAEIFFP